MLAYYVQWRLKRAWEPLLFEEEDMAAVRKARDPVTPAEPSPEVQQKKSTHQTASGLPVQSFATLLRELGRRCRNTCLVASDPSRQRNLLPATMFRLCQQQELRIEEPIDLKVRPLLKAECPRSA
jgi:hypothetical protein